MEQLLTEQETAAWLNVPVTFLQKDRTAKMIAAGRNRIPFLRIGSNIRYQPSAVQAALTEAAAAAMVAPPPKLQAAPKPTPDGQVKRYRGRPPGSPNKRKGC